MPVLLPPREIIFDLCCGLHYEINKCGTNRSYCELQPAKALLFPTYESLKGLTRMGLNSPSSLGTRLYRFAQAAILYKMLAAAFRSALSVWPQSIQQNLDWLFRLRLSTEPHDLHVWLVYAGFTNRTSPLRSSAFC